MIGFLVHDQRLFLESSAVAACRSLRTYRYDSSERLGRIHVHFFRNDAKNNYLLRNQRYTLCVAGTIVYGNSFGMEALQNIQAEIDAGRELSEIFTGLHGPYTLLVLDRKFGELALLNSREGLRNCYTVSRNGMRAYSTNLLRLAALSDAEPSAEGIRQFIHFGAVLEQGTIFDNVHTVGAASLERYRDSRWTSRRLWRLQPSTPDLRITREEATRTVRDAFVQNLEFTSRMNAGRAATDLTGGTDSRTMLCCLMESHGTPTASTAGANGFVDSEIAHKVSERLGVNHYWYRPTWDDLTPERIETAVELADGTREVIDLAKILPYYEEKSQRFDFITGGAGGPLFKDHYWLFEFNRVGLNREPDWQRIAKFSVVRYAIRDDVVPGFREGVIDTLAESLRRRSSEVVGTNNQKLDFVYFDLKVPAFAAQDFSLTTQFMDTVHPMLDGANVQYSINLVPTIRIRDTLLFGIIQSLRPQIRWVYTDSGVPTIPQVGMYSSLRALRLRRYTQAAVRKSRTALFGSNGEGTDQSEGVKRLEALGYFNLLNARSMVISPFLSTHVLEEFKRFPCRQPNQNYLIAAVTAELFCDRVKHLRAEINSVAVPELVYS